MRVFYLVVATAVGLAVTDIHAQTYPDFAGKWTLIAEKSEPKGRSAFGETFTATQDLKALDIIRQVVGPQGRGAEKKMIERTVQATYHFDGTETNADIFISSPPGSALQTFDTASWSDGKLTILRTARGSVGPPHLVKKQVMWLEADGTLVIETISISPTSAVFWP